MPHFSAHSQYIKALEITSKRKLDNIKQTKNIKIGLKKILFICAENACRSQIAEAFFNKYASGKAVAISAGTKPADQVNPKAVEVMKEMGIDISQQKPRLLTSQMLKEADRIITMGCTTDFCPAPNIKAEDWNIEDPSGKSITKFREVRDQIKEKVEKLIREIS